MSNAYDAELRTRARQIAARENVPLAEGVYHESKPKLAWKIGIDGLWNVLEVAREQGCAQKERRFIASRNPSRSVSDKWKGMGCPPSFSVSVTGL